MSNKVIPLLSLLFLFLGIDPSLGQVDFSDSNLPIIVINTNGETIVDEPKITCDMGIIWNGDGQRNALEDPFNHFFGKIGIEFRGSTSQQYPKKSYGLETRDAFGENFNVNLLGLPKENDWVLYGIYADKSLMRNYLTYALFRQMQPWSPGFVFCELLINGEYMGIYALIEKIKRDKNRVDIAKLDTMDNAGDQLTGGYIIKIDKPTGSSSTPWTSAYQEKVQFRYHDPKYEELSETQRDYIKNYVSDFEDLIYGDGFADSLDGYRSMIDVGSFIDFMLMQELGRTVDGYRSSSFMYKDRDSKGGKLACGPMWDFNLSYGNANYCHGHDTTGWQYNFNDVCNYSTAPPDWWARLLEDPVFADSLQCRWRELRSTILSKNAIDSLIDATALYLDEAQERHFTRWSILGRYIRWNHFIGETYQEEVDYLKWWFASRSAFLDAHIPGSRCGNIVSSQSTVPSSEVPIFHPNPTSGILFSSTPIPKDSRIEVFGIDGKVVAFERSAGSINLSGLPNGFYIIMINNRYHKILKQ